MIKKAKDNNPVLALWQGVLLDGRIYKLAKIWRKEIGIPAICFDSSKDFEVWHEKVKESKKESERISKSHKFIEESKSIIPYQGVLNEIHFSMLMLDFLYYGEVDTEDFKDWKYSQMGVLIIKDNKKFLDFSKEIEDGVYIKVGSFSKIYHILKYIDKKRDLIEATQKTYTEIAKIKKPKKIKMRVDFKKDEKILFLNQLSKKDIKEYFNPYGKGKYEMISDVMKKNGYKDIKIGAVRAVIQRRKLK